MIRIQRILVPTDFSDNSLPAVVYARDFALTFAAELHLLHIVEPSGSVQALPELPPDVLQDLEFSSSPFERSETRLKLLAARLPDKLTIHRHVDIGEALQQILDYAQPHHIDLIVLGTHGHTGLKHLLLGSVAERVVQQATCPVLTIRSSEESVAAAKAESD